MIREGAAKGPNFAGYFTIATWGCGSSCGSFAVIDAKTGRVFHAPFDILGFPLRMRFPDTPDEDYEPISYHLDSRLLIVRGCPEDTNCGSYYYEWQPPQFKLFKKVPARQATTTP